MSDATQKPSPTVTFQTVLNLDAETPKAFRVFGGEFLPKSLVTFTPTDEPELRAVGRYVVRCQIGNVTMPRWLATRR